ncbi:MAG TPA: glycosyltransferase family 9 protein [Chthonomonadales bacterium]|nr:glycosyltransferase family 9 protein [Chthonomonadales bacterium]
MQQSVEPDIRKGAPQCERRASPEIAAHPRAVELRESLSRARNVAVISKFRYMGDTIVATPFFSQLRSCLPDATITLITAPSVAEALRNCPHIDCFVPLELRGVSRWKHSLRVLGAIRYARPEAVFLLDRSLRAAIISVLAGIPLRIGYTNEFRGPLLSAPIPYHFDRNEVDCHLDMLRILGMPAQPALPELWITGEERQRALEVLAEQGFTPSSRPLIGLQPGANDPGVKEWGAARYAAVANRIADELNGRIVMMGGAAERRTADATYRTMRRDAIDLVARLDLRTALAVIGVCDLWIGNDTGLLHAAVAQRVPSVGLFVPRSAVRFGYDTARHRTLVAPQHEASEARSLRTKSREGRRRLDAITESMVLAAAREVFSASESEPLPCTCGADVQCAGPPFYAARNSNAPGRDMHRTGPGN